VLRLHVVSIAKFVPSNWTPTEWIVFALLLSEDASIHASWRRCSVHSRSRVFLERRPRNLLSGKLRDIVEGSRPVPRAVTNATVPFEKFFPETPILMPTVHLFQRRHAEFPSLDFRGEIVAHSHENYVFELLIAIRV